MNKITITEALSEINLIKKKIEAKKTKIKSALIRTSHLPDPFLTEGGSEVIIRSESQGMKDLYKRLKKIRSEISLANLNNSITILSETQTIHDWLIWKREIASLHIRFTNDIHNQVKSHFDMASKSPQVYKSEDDKTKLVEYKINIDYAAWLKEETDTAEILEKLDGQLSLKNATILIEI